VRLRVEPAVGDGHDWGGAPAGVYPKVAENGLAGSRLAEVVAHRDVRIRELEGEVARLRARVEVLSGVCHRAYEANNRAGRSTTERELWAGLAEVRRVLLGAWKMGSDGPLTCL
jgi:hypothetical protein